MATTNPSLPAASRFAVAAAVPRTVHASRPSSVLLVDEDKTHCSTLARALERTQYKITVAHDYVSALTFAEHNPPDYAVVALTYPGGLGLCFIAKLLARSARAKIVALADYTSMATATEALKLGASYFLPKPTKAEDVLAVLGGGFATSQSDNPKAHAPSLQKVQWEHILRVLTQNNGNISAAARELGMYRRTLQRKLSKNPPRA
jgi:two-component system response regulator RegA